MLKPDDPRFKAAQGIKKKSARLDKMFEICKKIKRCHDSEADDDDAFAEGTEKPSVCGCNSMQPLQYHWDRSTQDGGRMKVKFPANPDEGRPLPTDEVITSTECLRILQKLTDDDCRALGFDPEYGRPDWMILQKLPVSPPAVRPFPPAAPAYSL